MRALRTATDKTLLVPVPTRDGEVMFPCRVERSTKSKRIVLFVNDYKEVVIRIPKRASLKEAEGFLKSRGDWLTDTIKEHPHRVSALDFIRKRPWVSAFNRKYKVCLRFSRFDADYVFDKKADEIFLIFNPNDESFDPLAKPLRAFAQLVIRARAVELAEKHSLPLKRVSVRDQSGCWGSCSEAQGLSLNWRLVLLPPALHDHVILHELAHLQEMNHSERFYRLLNNYDSKSRTHNNLLDKTGMTFMAVSRRTQVT